MFAASLLVVNFLGNELELCRSSPVLPVPHPNLYKIICDKLDHPRRHQRVPYETRSRAVQPGVGSGMKVRSGFAGQQAGYVCLTLLFRGQH